MENDYLNLIYQLQLSLEYYVNKRYKICLLHVLKIGSKWVRQDGEEIECQRSKVVMLPRSDLYFRCKYSFENEVIHDAAVICAEYDVY